jgi:short-subunit dehydrogenase involved in D-alanine esterification of teichoic acids
MKNDAVRRFSHRPIDPLVSKQAIPLNGRVIAITGGARGIGRATAAALALRGARVAIGDLDLDLVTREAAEELGGGVIAAALDVTDRESFAGFIAETEQQLGPLDVLIGRPPVRWTRFLRQPHADPEVSA